MLKKLLSTPTTQLGKAGRFAVFQIKLWSHCARLLKKNHAGQQAASLSYHTIFGVVPLAIVTLFIFQAFAADNGMAKSVQDFVYSQLQLTTIAFPDPADSGREIMLTEYLDEIVSKYFTGLGKGSITIFSAVVVIWAALALLSTIERAFNNIWHVARGRNFLHRVINYWAVLTLGPLLLGVGIYITTRYAGLQFQKTAPQIGPVVLSYLVAVVAFFLLYFVLPNTRVKAKPAIWGAAVAALVFSIAKWGFGMYVIKFIPYSQVYGVMGLIPLSVFWIYITWLIVLFGLQLTFTTQHLTTLDAADIASARKTEDYFLASDFTVINIVREVAAAFEQNKAPVEEQVICSKLDLPAEFGDKILNHLVATGILIKSSEPRTGFMPAQDPQNIKLSDITDAVATAQFSQSPTQTTPGLEQITQSQRNTLSQYTLKQILSDNISD